MKITKYGHACVAVEENGKKVIIDPGAYTGDFGELNDIVAVVVTHAHADHFNPTHLEVIFAANPDAILFTTAEVTEQFSGPKIITAQAGLQATAGPLTLRFLGDLHALNHQSIPQIQNIAVCINDTFFYPGDSFTVPDMPVAVLAVPANAPWARASESIDYITQVKPERCFPTHNGLLSENGHTVYNAHLARAAQAAGVSFVYLQPREAIEC